MRPIIWPQSEPTQWPPASESSPLMNTAPAEAERARRASRRTAGTAVERRRVAFMPVLLRAVPRGDRPDFETTPGVYEPREIRHLRRGTGAHGTGSAGRAGDEGAAVWC